MARRTLGLVAAPAALALVACSGLAKCARHLDEAADGARVFDDLAAGGARLVDDAGEGVVKLSHAGEAVQLSGDVARATAKTDVDDMWKALREEVRDQAAEYALEAALIDSRPDLSGSWSSGYAEEPLLADISSERERVAGDLYKEDAVVRFIVEDTLMATYTLEILEQYLELPGGGLVQCSLILRVEAEGDLVHEEGLGALDMLAIGWEGRLCDPVVSLDANTILTIDEEGETFRERRR